MAPRTVAQNVNSLFFYIGLGVGLAVAAGIRPFLPALLAGALASGNVLGVDFGHHGWSFLESSGWLLGVTLAFVASWVVQIAVGPERFAGGPIGAAMAGIAIGVGALLFGGTLADHGHAAWPGLVGGVVCAALAEAALAPIIGRARTRLPDAASRHALMLYLDATSLVVALLVCLLHPLGYVALALAVWMVVAGRRRSQEKYAGLRILRR
jgi:hypothetical protein